MPSETSGSCLGNVNQAYLSYESCVRAACKEGHSTALVAYGINSELGLGGPKGCWHQYLFGRMTGTTESSSYSLETGHRRIENDDEDENEYDGNRMAGASPSTSSGLLWGKSHGYRLFSAIGRNPFRVEMGVGPIPRVAPAAQPWAMSHNPFGVDLHSPPHAHTPIRFFRSASPNQPGQSYGTTFWGGMPANYPNSY